MDLPLELEPIGIWAHIFPL